MKERARFATLAVAVMLVFATAALAQDRDGDRDDYYYRGDSTQARDYGYQSGYHDGYERGRHEGRENDPFDYRTPDWHQATHGYKSWMGPVNWFQNGYQEGYREGFRSGFATVRPTWRDRDGYRDGYYQRDSYYGNVGYRTGYQDGSDMAREDLYKGKHFNPNPRGRYDDKDHGYRREYGDKNYYKQQYTNGYRAGYQAVFDRRY